MFKAYLKHWLIMSMLIISPIAQAGLTLDWKTFKNQFLMSDGRVVDTGNKKISHSESQGYGMLFAVAANDKESFHRIWTWTDKKLKSTYFGLFYWRYDPTSPNPITDKNNASDGDLLIAWALLKAGKKWNNKNYLASSDDIVNAIVKHNVINFNNKVILLPGYKGFTFNSYINLNPSYFIFPAWQELSSRTNSRLFRDLMRDAESLLKQENTESVNLPTDWISFFIDGTIKPAREWPSRMSYDAIRVPLYTAWHQPDSPLLSPWVDWFSKYPRLKTPAWIDIQTQKTAHYNMNGGLLAVRDLTMNELTNSSVKITKDDDYYSATLKLLAVLAQQGF